MTERALRKLAGVRVPRRPNGFVLHFGQFILVCLFNICFISRAGQYDDPDKMNECCILNSHNTLF